MTTYARPIFISEIVQFGGAERSLVALSRWLHERGLPNYLLTYANRCDIARYATHPLTVIQLEAGTATRARIAALRRHLCARPAGAPVVLGSGYQPALHLTLARVHGFHELMHDTPALFSDGRTRAWPRRVRIAVSNQIVGYGLRSGGTTMVTSAYLQAECRRDFGVAAEIVRMGGLGHAHAVAARASDAVEHSGPLGILSIARMEPSKRIDWLLRGLARLEREPVTPLGTRLSELVDWRLDLVGEGAMTAALRTLAAALGIADRVRLHGFVPDEALEDLYAQAHLFAMPAVQGYGIPAIEALERGLPVVLHRESGVSDLLLDTPWATVFTGGEEALTTALARAIDGLLAGRLKGAAMPALPTEDGWAEQVATLCGWAG